MSDSGDRAALVERFYSAFNAQDLDAFVDTLDPAVELQTARGAREGRDEAREWATKTPTGELDQRIVVDEVRLDPRGTHAVALVRKQWRWRGKGFPAHEDESAALFTFRDSLIARWQPVADRADALALLAGEELS